MMVDELDRSGNAEFAFQDFFNTTTSVNICRSARGVVAPLESRYFRGEAAKTRCHFEKSAVQIVIAFASFEPSWPVLHLLGELHVDLSYAYCPNFVSRSIAEFENLLNGLPWKPASKFDTGYPLLINGCQDTAVFNNGGPTRLAIADAENAHSSSELVLLYVWFLMPQ